MAYAFGKRSLDNLKGVHPNLIDVASRAIQHSPVDFFVNEGVRTPERQRELYAQGRTKPGKIVTWTLKSNHFKNQRTGYGHAIDVYPYPLDWDDPKMTEKQRAIAKAMFKAADDLDIPIRWGADWDMDGNYGERGEGDSPHFELWGV